MSVSKKTISIIGCGWLGLPLAKRALVDGYNVKGSTTNPDKVQSLLNAGIDPYLVKFPTDTNLNNELFNCNYIVINIPPGRSNPSVLHDYPLSVSQLMASAKSVGKAIRIICISSTSVYGSDNDLIDEETSETPETDSGKALLRAEEIIKNSGINFNIFRFGGLAGPGRHPGRFLAGRKNMPNGHQAINYLHLSDAIGSIMHLLNSNLINTIYNVVSPIHPVKSDFYLRWAKDLGLEPPTFSESAISFKREISSQKFVKETGYVFDYQDPMEYKF